MTEYDIDLDPKFGPLQHIDVAAEAAAVNPWTNRTLTTVNDSVVRLGVVEGDFHWHKHNDEDEFFLTIEGRLEIDVENEETIVLLPQQGVTIPKGVMHRPRAAGRTVILMVEPATVAPTGD
jgi:mannose-6-phosphate isomerase-like protein (cupin superfamily)